MAPVDPPDGPMSGLSPDGLTPGSEPDGPTSERPGDASTPAGETIGASQSIGPVAPGESSSPSSPALAPSTVAEPSTATGLTGAPESDPVMQVAADLEAGRVSVAQAVDRLIASAIAELGDSDASWRTQLGDVLSTLAENDPAIARLEARLARASSREDDS